MWTTGDPTLDAIIRLGLGVLGVALGGLLLLRGYRLIWLFSGVAGFELAYFAVGLLNDWFGILGDSWLAVLIPIVAGILGALVARSNSVIAYGLIGFAAIGSIYLWLARILIPDETALSFWGSIALIIVVLFSLLLGALFAIRYDKVALILLSAIVGVILITEALGLNHRSELEALLALALALIGVVIQYHDYLRDQRTAMASLSEAKDLLQKAAESTTSPSA